MNTFLAQIRARVDAGIRRTSDLRWLLQRTEELDRVWELAENALREYVIIAEQLRQARLQQWHLPAVLWVGDKVKTYWPS